MAGGTWTFEIVDKSNKQIIENGINKDIGSGIGEKSNSKTSSKKGFTEAFNDKMIEDTFKDVVVSPLNTATGGLARPIYRTAKRLSGGTAAGIVLGDLGATLALMAIQTGIEHLQKKIADTEEKIKDLNNTDNALIRAGSVSKATYYSGNIFGIKKKTDRR